LWEILDLLALPCGKSHEVTGWFSVVLVCFVAFFMLLLWVNATRS